MFPEPAELLLDRLCDRINLDPKIQIRYVGTKNQMGDMFTYVVLHFDIALVTTRFTRESLVTTVSVVNLTVACVPEKLRDAFNLRSFLHECVSILLFIEGHNVFQHFDIAVVRVRFTRESLVMNVSLENLTVAFVWLLLFFLCEPYGTRIRWTLDKKRQKL